MPRPPAPKTTIHISNRPTTCTCRTFEGSQNPLPARTAPNIDPFISTTRIYPSTTLDDCPRGATRMITEHSERKPETDFHGRRFTLYRMYMKEVCAKGRYRKAKDIVLGEWAVSEELAESSLYNLLAYSQSASEVDFVPLDVTVVLAFADVCSACGNRRA